MSAEHALTNVVIICVCGHLITEMVCDVWSHYRAQTKAPQPQEPGRHED